MRKNKKLQKIANNSLQKIDNDDILNNLLQEQKRLKEESNIKKPFYALKHFKVACMTCACIIVSLAVVLCVVFIKPNDATTENNPNAVNNSQQPNENEPQPPTIPYYAEENMVTTIVSKKDLDSALANTCISLSINETWVIEEVSDNVSGDKLYFDLGINDEEKMLTCQMEIVINQYYNTKTAVTTNFKEIIKGKAFSIKDIYEFYDEEGIYFHTIYAETEVDGVKIYIREFTSITKSDDSGFKEFIESILLFS